MKQNNLQRNLGILCGQVAAPDRAVSNPKQNSLPKHKKTIKIAR
jgi:hypothetical protein